MSRKGFYKKLVKIGIDSHISPKVDELSAFSLIVVATAEDGEQDEVWIERAILAGAEYIVSSDLDIPNYLDHCNYDEIGFIQMPNGIRAIDQTKFILKNINRGMITR